LAAPPPKAKGPDPEQIFLTFDLARGMSFKGHHGIFFRHSFPVIDDPDLF
jgi:FRG1-like family.